MFCTGHARRCESLKMEKNEIKQVWTILKRWELSKVWEINTIFYAQWCLNSSESVIACRNKGRSIDKKNQTAQASYISALSTTLSNMYMFLYDTKTICGKFRLVCCILNNSSIKGHLQFAEILLCR